MSLTVSSPILRSIRSAPISTSPERGLNGLRSTSQLRRRAPSLSRSAIRLALTKMRRRWLLGDEADDAWRDRLAFSRRPARDHDDVVESADLGAAGIEQRQPHHPECVDQLTGHAGRLRLRTRRRGRGQSAWHAVGRASVGCRATCDLDQRVAVGDAAAPVGERVVGEAVGDLAVGVRGAPPAERDRRRRPARSRSLILTGTSTEARSFQTTARSPSARPRRAASAASSSTNGPPSAGPCLGRCGVARVQEAAVVLRCEQLQRDIGRGAPGRRPALRAVRRRSGSARLTHRVRAPRRRTRPGPTACRTRRRRTAGRRRGRARGPIRSTRSSSRSTVGSESRSSVSSSSNSAGSV